MKEDDQLISYILTFTEGILSFISPCILPMLPVYFLYLAGSSGDENASQMHARKSRLIMNSLGFVAGFTIAFVLLGAAAAALGGLLEESRLVLQKISGLIMILFGLHYIGVFKIGFLNKEKRLQVNTDRLRFAGAMLFGFVFGFGWSPCLGPFLGSAVMIAGNSGTIANGMLLLLVYSIGLAIPFVISAIIFENVRGVFDWLKKHSRLISIISGILLIVAGILVFTDRIKYFT
ncbi:MAG: cytochrome c biogenesis protein CcdA [Clostridiaceae bacterium]|nr:cytochrome c biogenesis protein CcdA [Clostridiaceae bacterium]